MFWGEAAPAVKDETEESRAKRVCVAEFNAHQFKGSKESTNTHDMCSLRYDDRLSVSRLVRGVGCERQFKGSEESEGSTKTGVCR